MFKRKKIIRNLIIILFFSVLTFQPNIVKSLFQLLNCQGFYPDPGHSYLSINMNIECYTHSYNKWITLLIVPGAFIFCLFLPLIAILAVILAIRKMAKNELLKEIPFLLQTFGFDRFYW